MEVRVISKDKKVCDTAKELLNKLRTTEFIGTLLGCIDIYRVIATASCDLQEIEQCSWEVLSTLNAVINKLDNMSQKSYHQTPMKYVRVRIVLKLIKMNGPI